MLTDPTPETDAVVVWKKNVLPTGVFDGSQSEMVSAEFARTLERQRDEALQQVASLTERLNHACSLLAEAAYSEEFDAGACADEIDKIKNALEPLGKTPDHFVMQDLYDRLCAAYAEVAALKADAERCSKEREKLQTLWDCCDTGTRHSGTSDRREWHEAGVWLRPGEALVIGAHPQPEPPTAQPVRADEPFVQGQARQVQDDLEGRN